MNKTELLDLEKKSGLTPKDLKNANPELYSSVTAKAVTQIKTSIDEQFRTSSKKIRAAVAKTDLTKVVEGEEDIQTALLISIGAAKLSAKDAGDAKNLAKQITGAAVLTGILKPDVPLKDQPLIREDLQKAKVFRIGEIAGLSEEKVNLILTKAPRPAALKDASLKSLVQAGTLTETEAKDLGLAASVYHLVDGNPELTEALTKGSLGTAKKGKIKKIRDLTSLDRQDWLGVLKESKIEPPEGMKSEEYATALSRRIASLYPTEALFARIRPLKKDDIAAGLDLLKPLVSKNKSLFKNTDFDLLDTDGIEEIKIPEFQKKYTEIKRLANVYPGLRIEELLDNHDISIAEKAARIDGRIGLFTRFWEQNSDVEFLRLNYSPGSNDVTALNFTGMSTEEQRMTISTWKAYQRIHSLTEDPDDAKVLLEAGYNSADSIFRKGSDLFKQSTSIREDEAEHLFQSARDKVLRTILNVGTIVDVVNGHFFETGVAERDAETSDFLKKIDGYEELFGSQAYCQCEHCQSIISPAAYFVDLMSFVEKNLLNKFFIKHAGIDNRHHRLNLKERRPDLWKLPLTCENTLTEIPSLDIINEILENYIALHLGSYQKKVLGETHVSGETLVEQIERLLVLTSKTVPGSSENIKYCRKVEEFVYQRMLSTSEKSFQQPFTLPLETLGIYLRHFNITRAGIAQALNKDPSVIAKAIFNLSKKEFAIITRSDVKLTSLTDLYGIPFEINESDKVTPFNAANLLKPMGLTRKELGELIDTLFGKPVTENDIQIMSGKKNLTSVQNDIEVIQNLTLESLDQMHRFIRLWRHTPWTIGELSLVLLHLGDPKIDKEATITSLGTALQVQNRFGISVEETCALIDKIPMTTLPGKTVSFFDRLFNLPPFVSIADAFPKDSVIFVHPSVAPDPSPPVDSSSLSRLRAGLQVSDEQLSQLIKNLSKALGSPSDKGFYLNLENLSWLFRHAVLARKLKLSIPDTFQLIALAGIEGGCCKDLTGILETTRFYDWWKTTDYSLDDLGYIIKGEVQSSGKYSISEDIVGMVSSDSGILSEIQHAKALQFADTLFAFIENITEEQSRTLFAENQTLFETGSETGTYRLSIDFNPSIGLQIPDDIVTAISPEGDKTLAQEKVNALLLNYHAAEIIPSYLAARISQPAHKIKALIHTSGANLSDPVFSRAIRGNEEDADYEAARGKLVDLVNNVLRLNRLFLKPVFDPESIQFIYDNKDRFAIQDFTNIKIADIKKIAIYSRFADCTREQKYSTKDPGFTSEDLQELFKHTVTEWQSEEKHLLKLGNILQADIGLVKTLIFHLILPDLPETAPEALQRLADCVEISRYFGVGGETLTSIGSALELIGTADTYKDLSIASNAVLGAIRAKYNDEKEWTEIITPFEDKIRSRKRDALVDYLINSYYPEFQDKNDIYRYLLIDVELDGCTRTSKVVAAISSVQLYVHRVLMNLEQDRRVEGDPEHIHVMLKPELVPQWQWRKNYRVWEANRKVFLFPENYIEPDLRDDKTPLFEEMESTLLQQEINEQNVLDAYASYLTGFDEVARLKIAGVYHDINYNPHVMEDILHLFGVTQSDPVTYYYRTIKNAYWGEKEPKKRGIVSSAWQKINVQIPVRKVAPIVYRGRLYVFWVEITTAPINTLSTGSSEFNGYKHKMSLKFTKLNLNGLWTAPQKINFGKKKPDGFCWDGIEDLTTNFDKIISNVEGIFPFVPWDEKHTIYSKPAEPKEDYTLRGFLWDQIYPQILPDDSLIFTCCGFFPESFKLDVTSKTITEWKNVFSDEEVSNKKALHSPSGTELFCVDIPESIGTEYEFNKYYDFSLRSLILERKRLEKYINSIDYTLWTQGKLHNFIESFEAKIFSISSISLLTLPETQELTIVNGTVNVKKGIIAAQDGIIDVNGDILHLQGSISDGPNYILKRLGTTQADFVAEALFTSDIDTLLDINKTQKNLHESALPIPNYDPNFITIDPATQHCFDIHNKFDFHSSLGIYYCEIFFHIPFLIANHLNSQQHFAAAQRWYHYIFNPTASEITSPPTDRNWRYIEFRDLGLPKLRDILLDSQAIEAYKNDPFNPDAIARLRLSAYQKSIVMKYIDNLLDWGDSLSTPFTRESINEATLLYILALDILGDYPAQVGECGEGKVTPKTYENIKPLLEEGREFLLELETHDSGRDLPGISKSTAIYDYIMDSTQMAQAIGLSGTDGDRSGRTGGISRGAAWKTTKSGVPGRSGTGSSSGSPLIESSDSIPEFGSSIVNQMSPVFCIPANKEFLAYWDRVQDRLYKIRHCMDITGTERKLALFAPEIDPRLLIRAKAAGLSIEDVLNSTSGNLPPYRFTYLIEKAKSYAGAVQSFGGALLSALEKKDVEELNRLRTVHDQNIQKLTTMMKQWEIDADSATIEELDRQKVTVTSLKDYYQGLKDQGLTGLERTQQVFHYSASIIRGTEASIGFTAATFGLLGDFGSPFAMKYGGTQTSRSAKNYSQATGALAVIADSVGSLAGLAATHERREQEWDHKIKQADLELLQIEKKHVAAEIRMKMAGRSLDLHQKNIEQTEEIYDFYAEKFSNLALFEWLATTLQRLHREAYNSAYSMAKLAEQAYRFERGDDSAVTLTSGYWDASRAGLLAGERLLIDLQNMERHFIETNYREMEIDQSFSLAQVNPVALINLRETGTCRFDIPEIFFDLSYPGQYRRKIKAVRLTIPCVVGPYVNVSATLTLTGSQIRNKPNSDDDLREVPVSRSTTIATSRGQNDAGVFEFNFHDERYMPFEGAGAISNWSLSLPRKFRQFDYQTISDVILHISYTAQEDGDFRDKIEGDLGNIECQIYDDLKKLKDSDTPLIRVFSLRYDFPDRYYQLLHNPKGTPVTIEINPVHFPFFLKGLLSKMVINKAILILRTAENQGIMNFKLSINAISLEQSSFSTEKTLGVENPFQNLQFAEIAGVFSEPVLGQYVLSIISGGDLAPDSPEVADRPAIDSKKLDDILLYTEFDFT